MYKMRTKIDCGLAAQAYVRSIMNQTTYDEEYDKLDLKWKMPITDHWTSNLRDLPGTHYRMMSKDSIKWKLVIPEHLILRCIPNQTIVLLHGLSIEESPTLDQHWAVVSYCDRDFVIIHLGNGKTYKFDMPIFRNLYYRGWPNCMYVMGEGETNQHKFEQFVDWCLSWII